jgi:Domain of unknown function (DUF305)
MRLSSRLRTVCMLLIVGLASGAGAQESLRLADVPSLNDLTAEAPFLTENSAAMDKMMADMNVKPTGDVDFDFSAMMIPHHQGAIDMALAELRYGKNEQLRRIAQEIVIEQQQEIIAMHMALGQPLPPSAPAQTQVPLTRPITGFDHPSMSHGAMSMSPVISK